MPSKTWGTPLNIKEYIAVGMTAEIPKGQKAYVFGQQQSAAAVVSEAKWLALMDGDMAEIRNIVETRIKGSKVIYVAVSWTSAERQRQYPTPDQWQYIVKGFKVEAIVENVSAGLTGLEIVTIVTVFAVLLAVIVLLGNFTWVTWKVISAAEEISPVVTIGVGIGILLLIALLLFVLFGGKAEVKGKKRRFRIGRG
jgi:hypothetical protein